MPQLLSSHASTREPACHKPQSLRTLEPVCHNYRAHAPRNPHATSRENPHTTTREKPESRNKRSRMPQPRSRVLPTKTRHSQINKYFLKRKKNALLVLGSMPIGTWFVRDFYFVLRYLFMNLATPWRN